MATSATKARASAAKPRTATKTKPKVKVLPYWAWEGKDLSNGRVVNGEAQAVSEADLRQQLRGKVQVRKVKRLRKRLSQRIKPKDIAIFTRQLATMMRAGVPLLQAFDIVGRGAQNPSIAKLLFGIKADLEAGRTLSAAFRMHPRHFDSLYCNLVEAGEAAGILEDVLERLATYREKTEALKAKIKSALFYPVAVIAVAVIITAIIMLFVVPAFKEVFSSFGAELPYPTLVVIALSDFVVSYWYLIFGALLGGGYFFLEAFRRSPRMQQVFDRFMLRAPIFGELVRKSVIARWTRTLATMFSAGVPLVDALDSVAGAAGNHVYKVATEKIQIDVSQGMTLTSAMRSAGVFPNMVLQFAQIGEEAGSLDTMLSKAAESFENDVDEAVKGISSLMEPLIMAVLGVIIGGLVVALYLPIFKLGSVV